MDANSIHGSQAPRGRSPRGGTLPRANQDRDRFDTSPGATILAVSIYVGLFLGLPLVLLSGVEFLAGFYLAGGLLLLYFLGTRAENLFIRAHASRAFNVSLSTVLGLLGLLLVGGVIFAALMFVASRQGSSGLSELVRWAAMASLALPVGAYLYVLVQSIVGIVKACTGQTVQSRAVVEVLKARA